MRRAGFGPCFIQVDLMTASKKKKKLMLWFLESEGSYVVIICTFLQV